MKKSGPDLAAYDVSKAFSKQVKIPCCLQKNQMKETQQKTRKRDGMKSEQGSGRTTVLVKDHAWFALDIAISTFVNQFHTTV